MATASALCRLCLLAAAAALLAPGAAQPSTAAPPDAHKAGATDQPHFVPDHTCPDTMFRCKNGRCLPKSWTCEGEDDCGDDSDEDPELCKGRARGSASDEDDAVAVVRVTPRPPPPPRPSKPTLDLLGARPAPLADALAPWRVTDNDLADLASAARRGDHDVRDAVIGELLQRLRTRNVVIERLLAPPASPAPGDLNGLEDRDVLADLGTPQWRRDALVADALFHGGRDGRAVRRAAAASSPDEDVGIGDGPLASVYSPKADKNPVSLSTYFTGVRSDPLVRGLGSPWTVIPVLNELLPQRTGPSVYVAKVLERVRRSLGDPVAPGPRALRRKNKGRPRHGSSTTTSTTPSTTTAAAAAESSAETPQDPSFAPGAVAEVVDIELDGDDSDAQEDDDDDDEDDAAAVVQDGTATPLEVVEPAHLPAGEASSPGGSSPGGPSPGVAPSTTTPVPINVVTTESEYALDRRQQRETARLNLDVLRRTVTMLQQETNKLAAEREMMTASRDMLRAQVRLVNTDRSRVDSARRKLDLERDLLQSQMLGRALSWGPAWYRPAPAPAPGTAPAAQDKPTGVEYA